MYVILNINDYDWQQREKEDRLCRLVWVINQSSFFVPIKSGWLLQSRVSLFDSLLSVCICLYRTVAKLSDFPFCDIANLKVMLNIRWIWCKQFSKKNCASRKTMKMAWICHLGMEDCLNGHAFKMPALSNHDQNNLISESQNNGGSQVEVQSRSSSEFLYHINHPEDVGAVVTSFCKVIQVCLFTNT